MEQEISSISRRPNRNVSGMAYWPLSLVLRSADLPLTMPLTFPRQEGRSATKSATMVFPFSHVEMPLLRLEYPAQQRDQA